MTNDTMNSISDTEREDFDENDRELAALCEILQRDLAWEQQGGPQTEAEKRQRELDDQVVIYMDKRAAEKRRERRRQGIPTRQTVDIERLNEKHAKLGDSLATVEDILDQWYLENDEIAFRKSAA